MFDSKPRTVEQTVSECDARAKRIDAMFVDLIKEVNGMLSTMRTHNDPLVGGRRLGDPQ